MLRRLKREVGRAIGRFRRTSLLSLAGLYGRALRLHGGAPQTFRALPTGRTERLVVTLTTVPARAKWILPSIRSLLDQDEPADRLILALPHWSRRAGTAYPDAAQLGLPVGVDVIRCDDEGPATKLLPALRAEPEALLVVVDDDVVYPRDFLRTLLLAHRRRRRAAIGYRGANLAPEREFADLPHVFATGVDDDTPVDILFGTWGYLLPPGVLDGDVHDFTAHQEEVRMVDDIWVSGHLARRGVDRIVTPSTGFPVETLAAFRASLASGPNRTGVNERIAISAFEAYWANTRGGEQRRSGSRSDMLRRGENRP